MIRLRRTLERGRAHPVLGPIVVILLALLLAMVFLHAAHEGYDAAAEAGAFCLAILTVLGSILIERVRRTPRATIVSARRDRGPPRRTFGSIVRTPAPASVLVTPLRR